MIEQGVHLKKFAFAAAFVVVIGGAHARVSSQDHSGHMPKSQNHSSHAGHASEMPYDLHYIDMMLLHNREGLEASQLAAERSTNARVKAFATKTVASQEKEIQQLQWHRDNLYAGRPSMNRAQMSAHMESETVHEGMKMDMEGDMRKLRAASGAAFDRLFLDLMSHHHAMALEMSEEAAVKASHAEIKELARKSRATQSVELSELKSLRVSMGGSSKSGAAKKPAAKKSSVKKSSVRTGHSNH